MHCDFYPYSPVIGFGEAGSFSLPFLNPNGCQQGATSGVWGAPLALHTAFLRADETARQHCEAGFLVGYGWGTGGVQVGYRWVLKPVPRVVPQAGAPVFFFSVLFLFFSSCGCSFFFCGCSFSFLFLSFQSIEKVRKSKESTDEYAPDSVSDCGRRRPTTIDYSRRQDLSTESRHLEKDYFF